jgi:hypothetical protein
MMVVFIVEFGFLGIKVSGLKSKITFESFHTWLLPARIADAECGVHAQNWSNRLTKTGEPASVKALTDKPGGKTRCRFQYLSAR